MGRQCETWRNSAYLENHDPKDPGNYVKGQVFVGMAFDTASEISDVYQAIYRACTRVKLEARRVDTLGGSGPIPTRILREIEDAQFLIFDLTVERPNVYYELGYAHGVGNRPMEILLIAKAGTRLHFDVADLAVVFYESATDLKRKLPAQLRRMIAESKRTDDGEV
jgi:hypothetical protein